jgi:hypothetical protein
MTTVGEEASSSHSDAKSLAKITPGKRSKLRFLSTEDVGHVAFYPILYLDRAMEEAGIPPVINQQSKATALVAKIASRIGLIRNVSRSLAGPMFIGFMGFFESRTFPISCWTETIPYCFDCWPDRYDRWTSFFKRHRVRIAFFSARQSAQHFAQLLPKMTSVWLPEATDPSEYIPSKPWSERDIDVLELGRKYDAFHDKIAGPLAQTNRTHLFERVRGNVIFPKRADFIEGMARSKISICFPSSQTHPERSGSVETVTHRYFESIASKCIIVGHAPQELIDLFGYNPVVEVRAEHEFEDIDFLLNNLHMYQELVDRNYQRLLEVGTFTARVATIVDILDKFYANA